MKEEGNKQLFKEFPETTTAMWEERIRADLKGAGYEKLIWKSDEGIQVKPFYRKEDIASLKYLDNTGSLKIASGAPNGWIICQDLDLGEDLHEINSRILAALKGGAQAIRLHFKDAAHPTGEMLGKLLEGVSLGETQLFFQGNLGADRLYEQLCELARSQDMDPSCLTGSLGADPLGHMARSGIPIASMENIGNLLNKVRQDSPAMKVIQVNAALLQNSGSTLVEELAFGLAMANEYLTILAKAGIDPVDAQDAMEISFSVGSNFFMEVAKLRAARILWSNISKAHGAGNTAGRIQVHARSSEWNLTLYDPYVNMLRGTTEAMCSILGGADSVSVLPFDYPYGTGNLFSDRIARNVQVILREEAYFDRVADPASGSYYIESLTDSIAEKSWDLFKEAESKGGFRKAFESGWIQEKVNASRTKKIQKAASGKGRILGTNAFPDFTEMILEKLTGTHVPEPVDTQLIPLHPFRLPSIFEEVRLETEKAGRRPRVFLFKYGNPVWMAARGAFSANFFACAGYEILDRATFNSIEAGIRNAIKERADMVVLCSSDDAYAETAPVIQNELKDHALVVIAGYPEQSIDALRDAGIEHFIHMKSNLLESLKTFNRLLL